MVSEKKSVHKSKINNLTKSKWNGVANDVESSTATRESQYIAAVIQNIST